VSVPDGKTFIFAASTVEESSQQAIFSVPADGPSDQAATAIHVGEPLSHVISLVMSCDGTTVYIADDDGDPDNDRGAIFAMSASGGTPTRLAVDGIAVPSGLAVGPDCQQLFVSGRDDQGRGALVRVSTSGGLATVIKAGEPLVSPTGLYVDDEQVSWGLDHLGGSSGDGVLFAIDLDGNTRIAADHLHLGTPAACYVIPGSRTAVLGTVNRFSGAGELVTLELDTGTANVLDVPDIAEPAGMRTARAANVAAIADPEYGENGAIFATVSAKPATE